MARRERLGEPSLQPDRTNPQEGGGGAGDDNADSTSLAGPAVVPSTSLHADGAPGPAPSIQESVSDSGSEQEQAAFSDVDHSRMAYLRRALKANDHDDATIETVISSWQPGTIKGYESYWKRWWTFASGRVKDPATRDDTGLANWLSTLVCDHKTQGTVETASTAITTLWDFIDNAPGLVTHRITKAAAKINGAKSTGKPDTWDICTLLEYVDGEDISSMKLSGAEDFTIVRVKGATGWRSADLAGLYHNFSFDYVRDPSDNSKVTAVKIRTFDTKVQKGRWSAWTTLPVLASRYKHICAARALLYICNETRDLNTQKAKIRHPDTGVEVQASPVFVYKKGQEYIPLQAQTIASKFRKTFLANVMTKRGDHDCKLDDIYKAHSSRNAVASALNDMGIDVNNIACHMNTSAQNLQSTYITLVQREWQLPTTCINQQNFLAAKLLVPYAHYKATGGDATKTCSCNNLLGSVPLNL